MLRKQQRFIATLFFLVFFLFICLAKKSLTFKRVIGGKRNVVYSVIRNAYTVKDLLQLKVCTFFFTHSFPSFSVYSPIFECLKNMKSIALKSRFRFVCAFFLLIFI